MLERCLRAGNNLFDLHSCYTQWAWFFCVDKLEEIMVYGLEQVNELAILCMGHKQLHSTAFRRRLWHPFSDQHFHSLWMNAHSQIRNHLNLIHSIPRSMIIIIKCIIISLGIFIIGSAKTELLAMSFLHIISTEILSFIMALDLTQWDYAWFYRPFSSYRAQCAFNIECSVGRLCVYVCAHAFFQELCPFTVSSKVFQQKKRAAYQNNGANLCSKYFNK